MFTKCAKESVAKKLLVVLGVIFVVKLCILDVLILLLHEENGPSFSKEEHN